MIPKLTPFNDQQTQYLVFLEALANKGFSGEIVSDMGHRLSLATDNSLYQVLPQGIVHPRDINDLITLTKLAGEPDYKSIVLTARGGGTGTNGQSLTDGIVVDTSRHMNAVLDINVEEKWARVQSGVVKDQLNAALKPHGLFFAPDLSTSNRATIGGMINTDASGQGSCVYGKTRDHVLELTTILADGSTLETRALDEEEFNALSQGSDRCANIHRLVDAIQQEHGALIDEVFPPLNRCLTGYDLAHIRDENGKLNLNNILCGSEGTLGFVAEAKLNLLTIPKHSVLVIVKYSDFNSSLRDATELMRANPTSIETIDSKVLTLAMNDFIWDQVETFFDDANTTGLTDDNTQNIMGINLVEFTGDTEQILQDGIDRLAHILKQSIGHSSNTPDFDEGEIKPTGRIGYSLAWGDDAVKRIWAMRKRAVGLLGNAAGEARPVPFVEDTAVPPENLADFILEFREILDGYQLEYGMFGHVDAGVLHVRPALDMKDPQQEEMAWEISDRVADLCQQYHGLLWGEHGKGVRSEYSPKFFGELYPQLQRIKAAFDPYNQLNPGKIATPSAEIELLKINEVPTRGQYDREIAPDTWKSFSEAVYCNGNGACYNWNPNDAMCPSWKGTRDRIHSPKGRASLVRTWLKLLSDQKVTPQQELKNTSGLSALAHFPGKLFNAIGNRNKDDFSHDVYDAMAGCLSCKACAGQCPIKVDVPEFRSRFIALYHTRYLRPLKDYLVGTLEFLLPVCAKLPLVYNTVMGARPIKYLLEKWVGFIDGPQISRVSLRKRAIEVADIRVINRMSDAEKANTVVIVQDAFTRYFETPLIIDIVLLLRALGFTPYIAPYKANGKPLHVHGFLNWFTRVARRNSKMLNRFSDAGIALIGVDPSMTYTYRAEYTKFLQNEDSEHSAPNVLLLQEWLSQNLERLQTHATDQGQTFTLMPHCIEQSHATKERDQWKLVFEALGHTLDILSLGCCGMSGTYGHEARNQETSKKIYALSWKKPVANIETTQLLATGYSCRSQIKREDGKRVQHPFQALLKCIPAVNEG
ncbi:D-2-hydroxyglutarate dehydrogenase YdiJ [Teredinibacter purpureus]|uniref:D-2-hydroxyglutarate dehydrogenase YdiJ n=1 Tax=Teredinibacter purpureus TaxID=2731756 RepID=UPI0005F7CC4E|nr:FAD-binding and (Fe-S)-binding domain-containing protein [Teredinibacter purpureus]